MQSENWLHFAEKSGDTVLHVLRLPPKGHCEKKLPGVFAWNFYDLKEMKQDVEFLAINMDRWHRRHNITSRHNQRIHQDGRSADRGHT